HLNNLLMVLAVALFLASTANSRVVRIMRHPMLVGLVLWSVAHLLIAGEFRAIVLFGGMAFWAVATIIIINSKELGWQPSGGTAKGDLLLAGGTVALVALIGWVHIWLGLQPFGG
ncbi:MAG: NnrU family protein, partial [Deltaproteobacteria bacterium]